MESASQAEDLPTRLSTNPSFWGMLTTQFLGAFNDNVFKQLVLLMAISEGADLQGWATLVFSVPFVLFSGYAGFLSDKFSKTPIIVYSKVAEIVVMLLGLLAFLFYDQVGMIGTWTVLFLMATQSTFFGPGKYGILPELFGTKALPRANGLMVMTTFLAIIFGVVMAGNLYKRLVPDEPSPDMFNKLWIGSAICIGIALAGTLTSLLVRRIKPAQPESKFTWDNIGVSYDIRKLLMKDRVLLNALLVSCVFWMVSTIAMPTVNRLGLGPLKLDEEATSLLVGLIAIGIMVGAPLGSLLCRFFSSRTLITGGLWGIVVFLVALSLWDGTQSPLLGLNGCRLALVGLGIAAAIYSIPLQVFLQERPPNALKGRLIATMNQGNFLGMLLAGPLYQLFELIANSLGTPINSVFLMIALLVLPLAMFYRLDPTPINEN